MAKGSGNRKGKAGERELARKLTELGYPARRGQQYKGTKDSPDIICEKLDDYHIECKRYKQCVLNSESLLQEWWKKAIAEAGERLPIIIHRWDGSRQWWVCREWSWGRTWCTLEDFLKGVEDNAI